ncbi:histidine kinase [Nocardia sp. NPDC005366]|uniref:sensor histidine kinase n=1 Tax=Nocardia sp. NPDC005366 TaxID=3156878 RepID=UPI0033BEE267
MVQVVGGRAANLGQHDVHALDWFGYILLLAGPVALIFRRRQPLAVLLIALAAAGIYLALDYGYGPIFVSLVIAFLTAAIIGSRWWTYPLVPVGYLLMVWPLPRLLGRPTDTWQQFGIMAWLIVLVAAAEGIRQRRAVLQARAQRAEATRRDEEAQRERRAGEERLAIARELHDVLAHSLSLINVQSSVALELFDKKPQQAATALAAIKTASKEALAEVHVLLQTIRTGTVSATTEEDSPAASSQSHRHSTTLSRNLFGVRRDTDERTRNGDRAAAAESKPAPAPRAPTPTIDDLDGLLQRTRAAGVHVDTRVIGTPEKLPSVLDVAAARIIQESLTNVVRHAPGANAIVTVRYTPESVDLTIDNTRPTAPQSKSATGGRNGIIGMRERAHALGGQLTAGPRPSGGFRVAARLPVRVRATTEQNGRGGSTPAPDDSTAREA